MFDDLTRKTIRITAITLFITMFITRSLGAPVSSEENRIQPHITNVQTFYDRCEGNVPYSGSSPTVHQCKEHRIFKTDIERLIIVLKEAISELRELIKYYNGSVTSNTLLGINTSCESRTYMRYGKGMTPRKMEWNKWLPKMYNYLHDTLYIFSKLQNIELNTTIEDAESIFNSRLHNMTTITHRLNPVFCEVQKVIKLSCYEDLLKPKTIDELDNTVPVAETVSATDLSGPQLDQDLSYLQATEQALSTELEFLVKTHWRRCKKQDGTFVSFWQFLQYFL